MKQISKALLISALLLTNISICIGAQTSDLPNIIWITFEDLSPEHLSVYGNELVKTPHIDQLAADGVLFTRAYTVAGVCAPSRSGIITGMHPVSIGTQHMRTRAIKARFMPQGIPMYDAVLPEEVKAFPEYLRRKGYYSSNNMKEDYQFKAPVTVWDESSPAASYRNRGPGQAFFSVYNFFITHESQLMHYPDSLHFLVKEVAQYIPKYYEDTPTVRKDIANLFTRVETLDEHVGELIEQLKQDGVYEDSYIFFFSDHGGNLPWTKREVLERGTHIPLIVKFPKSSNAGTVEEELVSSVDFAPTVLSLAGVELPEYLQGRPFLGANNNSPKRKYVYAARDRMDSEVDRVRSVRDTEYRYVYNYYTDRPKYQDLKYRKGIPMMKEILDRNKAGILQNPYLSDWFQTPRVKEELYHVTEDKDELQNLAAVSQYRDKLLELRQAFWEWTAHIGDLSSIPEIEMVSHYMWNGLDKAPETKPVQIIETEKGVLLWAPTKGTSIGYRIVKVGEKPRQELHRLNSWDMPLVFGYTKMGVKQEFSGSWNVYQGEYILLHKGDILEINAMRIGYTPFLTEYHLK